MKVSVIGAGGHVGLPFSLVVANAGHMVYGIDTNENIVKKLNRGFVPYVEQGAKELLVKLHGDKVIFTQMPDYIKTSDVVAIMLGTPVDEEGNARLDGLFDFVDNTLLPNMTKGKLIILRSTVSPGTTDVVIDRINKATGFVEGIDYFLVFCPERVMQGHGIEETSKLPQLVGANSEASFKKAKEFFETFVTNEIIKLTLKEAEIGKLVTNMWRRMNGAFANELYMIGDNYNIDINKVIKASNNNYDRMNALLPGFMSGPCLYKDGEFLVGNSPYNELIKTSFEINEGFVGYIFNKSINKFPKSTTFGILGTGFKANCDDERQSLGHKMKKIARMKGLDVKIHDPYHDYDLLSDVLKCDIVIMMVPHIEYLNLDKVDIEDTLLFVDIWKFTEMSKETTDGFVT